MTPTQLEAILAEREACAKVARYHRVRHYDPITSGTVGCGVADKIAADILNRPTPAISEIDMRDTIRGEIINTPETTDFMAAVPIEAAHQRDRWSVDHDAGKSPFDWFWLIGYLAQKAADASVRGDVEKAKHHTISTAAAPAPPWSAPLGRGWGMGKGLKIGELRRMLGLPRFCGVCGGTGKLPAYRGPTKDLPCHFCDGTGETRTNPTQSNGEA